MPHYFFDTDDGSFVHRDENGAELADDEAARLMAQAALPEMVHDTLPDGERRAFKVQVRAADGSNLYTVCLTMTGEWQDGRVVQG